MKGITLLYITWKSVPRLSIIVPPVLAQVFTFSEAADLWNIHSSTLRHRVTSQKLLEGIDYKKSGKVWLITKSAMERLYGIL